MRNKTPILFPVEIVNRELDYKLFLACMSLRPSNRIYIGQHDAIFRLSQSLRGGVYVGKNLFLREWPHATMDRYNCVKARGFILVHLDEEGAIYNGLEGQWQVGLSRRLDPTCLAAEDYICTWGDFQRDYYRSFHPRCTDHIVTTGYPKFDLYKTPYREFYGETARRMVNEYGDFILINTNFAYGNYGMGYGIFSKEAGYYEVSDAEKRSRFLNVWEHDTTIYANFVRLINELSIAFPGRNLVVRPHPGENHQAYRDMFAGIANIHVVHRGEVAPWLLASKVLVHNGCTTAIEAHFLNTSVVNYRPVEDVEVDLFLPNLFGVPCATAQQVVEQVKAFADGPRGEAAPIPQFQTAARLISNLDTAAGLGSLLRVIDKAESEVVGPVAFRHLNHFVSEGFHRLYGGARNVVRPLFAKKQKVHKFLTSPSMYGGLFEDDIRHKISAISEILKKAVVLRFHTPDLFSLEARD